ncbi:MAG: 2-amino-4-hydroxy-6-hydroxymethyldihydropteridine diphosphokinase [Anaerolineales bacterium]|nr:2-amino-4-hydroxy-6-hydroxymethyldihydropteridine diphosphokinase [Anaerolineae bacterium]PWB54076.1 MAG: 2-amino-4-hydroxy-6-hydroxymethyldihydropteridine diphosphokinase [Anaerolineales bacterium]
MAASIYLSLGSNLGNRLNNLQAAMNELEIKISQIQQSPIYETEPWGYSDQPLFLNQVIRASTSLEPHELLTFLKATEVKMGRQETFRFGPRLIDLDILFYDDVILETPDLTIPHPRMTERAFIIIPLSDIAPDLIHPVAGKTIQQLKAELDPSSVRLYKTINS